MWRRPGICRDAVSVEDGQMSVDSSTVEADDAIRNLLMKMTETYEAASSHRRD